ncbi:uncharacterized protein LOC121629704 [Melanotaenia boesemani]|uniref:uncharacterized protein LOC121629704 n=1 Tax=Melanotaenia boesemani TaxID=1250792 RepID=UPI001C05ADE5|nr:uncharacterized protein LOC121629704 [Melanotaenia boesemani]
MHSGETAAGPGGLPFPQGHQGGPHSIGKLREHTGGVPRTRGEDTGVGGTGDSAGGQTSPPPYLPGLGRTSKGGMGSFYGGSIGECGVESATRNSPGFHTRVCSVFPGFHAGISSVFPGFHAGISSVFPGFHAGISSVFPGFHAGISSVFPGFHASGSSSCPHRPPVVLPGRLESGLLEGGGYCYNLSCHSPDSTALPVLLLLHSLLTSLILHTCS